MENLGAIILAGGKSSRMGEDKGLMHLFGKPMVSYVIDRALEFSKEIIIVSNNPSYKKFGHTVVKDRYKEKGPLAGLHIGLIKSPNEKNIVLSCDVPYIRNSLLEFLLLRSEGYDVTIVEHRDRIHPLIGIYSKSCIPRFEDCLEADQLKITLAYASLNFNIAQTDEFDDLEFKNLNSKNDIVPF